MFLKVNESINRVVDYEDPKLSCRLLRNKSTAASAAKSCIDNSENNEELS